ncbi:MAG TPA: dihydroorotate dehydrogenase-like protein, partial [bacterium]|nr:dihydroorotate dehydrogenase-like protein [bacterium]
DRYNRGPEWYLEHIHRTKAAVGIPIIASLNGSSHSGWLDYAKKIEQAGADALELNMYYIAADIAESATSIEHRYLEIARTLRQSLRIPIAIKLSPFFTSFAHFAKHMDDCGINGLVLFNRFYQPDINLETLDVMPNVILSQSTELRLALRWIAILHGRIRADLAATGGIHTHEDVIKALLAGASVTMVCSTLLKNGIARITDIVKGMETWLVEREYESVKQLQGSMSQKSVSDPTAFERANYMRALSGYNLSNDLLYHN